MEYNDLNCSNIILFFVLVIVRLIILCEFLFKCAFYFFIVNVDLFHEEYYYF